MRSWLRTGRLLVGIGWEIGPRTFLLYVASSVLGFVVPLVAAIGLRPLVDGMVGRRGAEIAVGAGVVGFASVLMVVAPAAYRWTTIRMRERAIMVMQHRFLRLATGAPRLEHFERPEFWDRLQVLKRSIEPLSTGMTIALVGPIVLAQLIVTAVLLAQVQPVLLFLPVVAIPAALLSRRAETLRRDAELATAEPRRTGQHLFALAATPAPAIEVRLYNLRAELLRRHRAAAERVRRPTERAQFRAAGVESASRLLFAVAYVGAIVIALAQAAGGSATPGDVALALTLATATVLSATRFAELTGSTLRVRTAAEHYHWLEDQAAGRTAVTGAVAPPVRLEQGLALDHVSFAYPGATDRAVLTDVSLELPAGTVVAVVGENGAGKTTLVKLLTGMYDPTAGRILVDGAELRSLELAAYRERIAAGFQDFVRFELPVRESVGVGDLPRIGDVEAVETVLRKANAGFVDGLPAGVETPLGGSWEGGVDLSGGEWQKLALGRSMLRARPYLVVLDEPTASLDPQTEHALFEQVAADARVGRADGRVTILISHRFSTVRMADLIVVLDRGRVRELGSHEELLARAGLYAELYRLQATAYR